MKLSVLLSILLFSYLQCGFGFLLDTNIPKPSGVPFKNNQYLTVSEFYDSKQKQQNEVDLLHHENEQLRRTTSALRNEMDSKLSLLTSQLQQMLATFQQQMKENNNKNESRTIQILSQKYDDLSSNYTKLQQEYTSLHAQQNALLNMQNKTNELEEKLSYVANCTNITTAQRHDMVSVQNKLAGYDKQIEELQDLKTIEPLRDFNALQKQLKSLNKQTQVLNVNDRARTQDFMALYNLTVSNNRRTDDRFEELERKQNLTYTNISTSLDALETEQNATFKDLSDKIDQLQKFDTKTHMTMTNLQNVVSGNSKRVGVTSCISSSANIQSNTILRFDDIRTHIGVNSISSLRRSGKFTCETEGLYLVSAWVMSQTKSAEYSLYKSGTFIAHAYITGHSSYAYSSTSVVVVDLQPGDTVWAQTRAYMDVYGSQRSCLTVLKVK